MADDSLWRKTHCFFLIFCDIVVRCRPILLIFGRSLPEGIWKKHICTAHHSSFYMFVLYLVETSNGQARIAKAPVSIYCVVSYSVLHYTMCCDVTCVFSQGAEDGSFPEELWVTSARWTPTTVWTFWRRISARLHRISTTVKWPCNVFLAW